MIYLPVVPTDNGIILCLNAIIQSVMYRGDYIIHSINTQYEVDVPNMRVNIDENIKLNITDKPDMYLIDTDHVDIRKFLKQFDKQPHFNPRAKYVLFGTNIPSYLSEYLGKYFLVNTVFINTKTSKIFINHPYQNKILYNISLDWNEMQNCEAKFDQDLFPEKIPKVWRETKIKACFFPVPPYTTSCSNATICEKRGYEFELLELIWGMMNVSWYYSQYEYPGNDYNEVDHQKLLDRKCDIILKQFIHLDLDCIYAYIQYNYHWIVPTAGQIPRWKYVIGIFSKELWLLWIITFVILCLAWYIVDLVVDRRKNKTELQRKIFILASLSVDSPQNLNFKYLSEGFLIIAIIFFTWIMSLIYRSRFPFLLAGVNYEKGIDTVQDIMKHNLMIGSIIYEIAEAQFSNIGPEAVDYLNSHFVTYCDFGDYCTQQVAYNRNMAVVKSSTQFASFQKDYINKDGRYLIKKLDPPLTKFHIGSNMIKGHPLFPRINNFVLLLEDLGIKRHIVSPYESPTLKSPSSLGIHKLDLDHILAPLVMWVVGMSISFVVFILEQITFKITRHQKIKKNYWRKIINT